MMKKRLRYSLWLLLWIVSSLPVWAQQDPLYSQYMFDPIAINPAFAGSKNAINTALAYRQQFAGFEGAPQTAKLTFSAPLQTLSMGLGLRAYNDRIGASSITGFNAIYAYHLGLGDGKLSFGLEGGILNQTIDFNSLDKTNAADAALAQNNASKLIPDAAFGMFYYTERWYLGGSIYHLLGNKIDFTGANRPDVARLSRHYFATAGYHLDLSKTFALQPSFLLRSVEAFGAQADFNLNAVYDNLLALGVSYRTAAGIALLARIKVKDQYIVGYSYDINTSAIGAYAPANHEIMVAYRLNLLPPARTKIIHPRFYF